ncbi:restriction endonuclease subunit S [Granulicatella sp. HMSC30F09]|uniref:restriction endonuclease subunit S n=1 Tax=Granulicatella sp. HMSC30F09 TaxID=1581071 RepID=UPI000A41A7C4|nr:restriction endonuclease subunit S [Granulicatella sp. HMSC30F09]
MGEGQKNVPKLRFKGYEDAWEQRKLGEIAESTYGGGTPKTTVEEFWNGGIPWIQSSDIQEDQVFNVQVRKTITEKGLANSAAKLIPKNSVAIVTRVGVGKLGLIPFDFTTSQDFLSLSNLNIDSNFAVYLLFKRLQFESKMAQGTSIKGITKEELLSKEVKIAHIDMEQKSIGYFFQNLDDIITLHQRKYDALKSMKKTLLLKMFPKDGKDVPEIRFKEFTDAWEQRKLGEVSQIVGGGTPSTGIPDYWDGDIDWYSPAEIGEEIFVSCSQRKITQLGLEKSSAKILPVGTVLFTSRAGIGNTAILEKEGCTNQGFQSIVPKDNELDSYFIFSCSHLLKKYGETKGAGSTFVEISGKQMSLMPLNIPEIKEQKSVGNFFRKLDSIITLHQRKLEELKNMKKTLLQQMFV